MCMWPCGYVHVFICMGRNGYARVRVHRYDGLLVAIEAGHDDGQDSGNCLVRYDDGDEQWEPLGSVCLQVHMHACRCTCMPIDAHASH